MQFEQKKTPFIIIEIANHFNIEETTWNNLKKTENGLIIPKEFASHLVMLTIGTLRGTLHCKTENTEFSDFILPTINVTELIKRVKEVLRNLRLVVNVLLLDNKIIGLALNNETFADFEGGLQYFTAIEHEQEIIITRNLKDYKTSQIPVMTARQFLETWSKYK